MRKEDKDARKARLNQLGEQWGDSRGANKEAVRLRLQNDIFLLVYELFPNREEAINTVFIENWKDYDPAKGDLYGFMSARISLREKDLQRKISEKHLVKEKDPVTGEEKREWKSRLVQEPDPRGSAEGSAVQRAWDNAADDSLENQPEDALRLDETACILISSMLNLRNLLEGRENNPRRRRYYQMFFTDGMTTYLHQGPVLKAVLCRERDLFQAMELPFLDYYMSALCRTVGEIRLSPLKPYGQLVDGRPLEETRLPLPSDVYSSYLKRIEGCEASESAVSNQRKSYRAFLKRCLF